jgi:hypothetical protein
VLVVFACPWRRLLLNRPTQLALVKGEGYGSCTRKLADKVKYDLIPGEASTALYTACSQCFILLAFAAFKVLSHVAVQIPWTASEQCPLLSCSCSPAGVEAMASLVGAITMEQMAYAVEDAAAAAAAVAGAGATAGEQAAGQQGGEGAQPEAEAGSGEAMQSEQTGAAPEAVPQLGDAGAAARGSAGQGQGAAAMEES